MTAPSTRTTTRKMGPDRPSFGSSRNSSWPSNAIALWLEARAFRCKVSIG
jgi:hypothetical protein